MLEFLKTILPADKKQWVLFICFILIAYTLGWLINAKEPDILPVSEKVAETRWTCSMHPQIQQSEPGQCPICGMDLIPVHRDNSEEIGFAEIALSERARKLAQIRVGPVERKFVETEIRLVGKIDYDETGLAYITAWVPGRIDRMYVDYTGITVRKGDHMVDLYSPELVSTQQELLQTIHSVNQTNAGMLKENIQSIRERLRLWGLTGRQIKDIEESGKVTEQVTINAPMSGVVIAREGLEGMYVNKGTRLYTIADLSTVWLFLEAYESDIQWVRYGQDVTFTTEAYPGEKFTGKIAFIDPVLDNKTRTVKIRVNVNNQGAKLKPGMFVRAMVHSRIAAGGKVINPDLSDKWVCPMHPDIIKNSAGNCDICGMSVVKAESLGYISASEMIKTASLVIPATAPLITGERAVVYVQISGQEGVFEGREVTLGPRAGDYYIVEDGLKEGELVVTHGNFKIDSAIQIQAGPSMMNPEGGIVSTGHEQHGASTYKSLKKKRPETEVSDKLPPAFLKQLDAIYDAYFDLQAALSHDHSENIQRYADKIAQGVRSVEMRLLKGTTHTAWMEIQHTIKEQASIMSEANDLDDARPIFKMLSESMIHLAQKFGSSGKQPVLLFHCPMAFENKGADWLQNREGSENTYFGGKMFKCGNQEKDLTYGHGDRDGGQRYE